MSTPRIAVPRLPSPRNPWEASLVRAIEQWAGEVSQAVRSLATGPDVLDDSTRGTYTEGRVIFNSDDGNLNIGDGAQWILPDGSAT